MRRPSHVWRVFAFRLVWLLTALKSSPERILIYSNGYSTSGQIVSWGALLRLSFRSVKSDSSEFTSCVWRESFQTCVFQFGFRWRTENEVVSGKGMGHSALIICFQCFTCVHFHKNTVQFKMYKLQWSSSHNLSLRITWRNDPTCSFQVGL